MIVAIILSVWFYRMAKDHGLNKIVWPIIGFFSYLGGQIIAGMLVGLLVPELLNENGVLIIIGIAAGVGGVLIARFFLMQQASNKRKDLYKDSELIDNEI